MLYFYPQIYVAPIKGLYCICPFRMSLSKEDLSEVMKVLIDVVTGVHLNYGC